MLRVLRLLAGNLGKAPQTVRFPNRIPVPSGFRGPVILEPDRCLACGLCSYVCVSEAIRGAEEEGAYVWRYEPGRCTFCARCAERCPGGALALEPQALPPYRTVGDLSVEKRVPLPACARCGAPTRPANDLLVERALTHTGDELRELARLCPRCRQRRLARDLAGKALEGEEEPKR